MESDYSTQSNSKKCSSCQIIKQINKFETNKETCIKCLTRINKGKKRKRQEQNMNNILEKQESAIEPEDIKDVVYKKLMDNMEEENARMDLNAIINLSNRIDKLENNDESHASLIVNKIVRLCEKGDGYSYVYYKKHYIKQTKSTTFTYWCNCHQELEKKAKKVLDNSKQCNTESRLDCYDCKGAIFVRIDLQNKLASVKLDHVYLHPQPQHIGITDEIKIYIKENLVYSAPELYKQIVLEKINGYELIMVDQAYYWWAHHAVTKYQRANNQFQSAKLLLNEKNYKIIFEIDDPVGVFAFITPFIAELPKIAFETLLV